MSLASLIYLVDFLSNLNGALSLILGIILTALAILGVLSSFLYAEEDMHEQLNKLWFSVLKKSYIVAIIFGLLIVIPSKQSMYLMLGSKYLKDSNVPAKVYDILNLKLDSMINEIRKKDATKT